jgi:hypothetical protein
MEVAMDHLVKVSVFLPETVHHRLKLESVERRTSLQKVIADLAGRAATESASVSPTPADVIDSLSLVTGVSASMEHNIGTRVIKRWQSRLKRILESRNRLAILNCTSSIEAMELVIKERAPAAAADNAQPSPLLQSTMHSG